MSNTQALPPHLMERGWKLVHDGTPAASEDDSGDTGTAVVVLERLVSSKAVRAVGRDLAHAIEDAEALDQRLSDYPEFVRSAHGVVA